MDTKIQTSHLALSKSISDFGSDLKKVMGEVAQIRIEAEKHTVEHRVINLKLNEIEQKIQTFITKDQFWPVKTLVYSTVGIILVSVLIAGIALIVKSTDSHLQVNAMQTL